MSMILVDNMRIVNRAAIHRHRTPLTIHVVVVEMDEGVWVIHMVLVVVVLVGGLFIVVDLYREKVGVTGRGVPSSLYTESSIDDTTSEEVRHAVFDFENVERSR